MAWLFNSVVEPENYSIENGACAFDRGPTTYLKIKEQNLDLGLLSCLFPLGVRVCPRCLLASSESDFLSGILLPGTDSINGALNYKHSSLANDLAVCLPLRLGLMFAFIESLDDAEFRVLIELRKPKLNEILHSFFSVSFHGLPSEAGTALAKHLIQLVSARRDPESLVSKLVERYQAPPDPDEHDFMAHMVKAGANPLQAVFAIIYGTLVSGFDAEMLELFGSKDSRQEWLMAKLALFHLEQERLTILTAYVNAKQRLKLELQREDAFRDYVHFVEVVESKIQAAHSEEQAGLAQRGYHYLNMGRSCYKSARLLLDMAKAAMAHEQRQLFMDRAVSCFEKAWGYLELSLVAEKYPEFEAQERPQSLCQKGRIKVPFFFGEFGVRLMLCWLYNELAKMADAGKRTSKTSEAFAKEMCVHWLKIQGKFREVEFGGFDDPKAAKMLIPRMMAWPAFCFNKQAADMMRKLIAANQERLYGRYEDDARAFIAAQTA